MPSSPGSPDRFYGMPMPPDIAAGVHEGLTRQEDGDLVEAHLRANFAYFGAIDKTLAGFVVLDDEGDNYTLLDLRGGGAVWRQDHETRDIHLRLASLADWGSFRRDKEAAEAAEEYTDEYELLAAYSAGAPPPHDRAVSSVDLAARYQWLVWLLAQPLTHDGHPIQDDTDLAGSAAGHHLDAWPSPASAGAALDAEIGTLADDPHLTIYWLLHTAILGMDTDRERVLAAGTAAGGSELLSSFVDTFAALAVSGDVPAVPGFRARRSMLVAYLRREDLGEGPAALLAAEMSPRTRPLGYTAAVADALDDGSLDTTAVAEAVARMDAGLTRTALRALLDSRDPAIGHSPAADELVAALPTTPEPWTFANWALDWARPVTGDLAALTETVRWLLTKDSHQRLVLAAVRDLRERGAEPPLMSADELTRAEIDAEASSRVLRSIADAPEDTERILTGIGDPALARVVARRVLMRADMDEGLAGAASWAARTVLDGEVADAELAAAGLALLPAAEQKHVIGELGGKITSAEHPLVPILLRLVLEAPEAAAGDFAAAMKVGDMKEAALLALAPFAHDERIFDPLMRAAEEFGSGSGLVKIWDRLFYPFERERCVIPRLSPEQAERAIRAMIATKLGHPDIHARNSAGHQLYRFDHPAVADFAIAALDDYGARYADSEPKSGRVFDHGQTEDDNLEDVVADLYSVLRNLDTPATRAALIGRIFTERRSFWRAANALSEIWNAGVHAEIMQRLRRDRDHIAAGLYAYTLDRHVEKTAPLADLADEIGGWDVPADPASASCFKYALVMAARGALGAHHFDVVRVVWSLAEAIEQEACPPGGRSWTDPFADTAARAELEAALSGVADQARTALVEKARAARKKGKPLTRLKDADLGTLTGATVHTRLLHDRTTGEVWFVDTDEGAHAFDGYEAVATPFTFTVQDKMPGPSALTGITELSERAMFWTATAGEFTELVRYGDRIAYSHGADNGRFTTYVLHFGEGAPDAFARMRATLAAGKLVETGPWYVPGKGCVMRSFHAADAENARLFVHAGMIEYEGEEFGDTETAVAANQRRELELLAAGGRLACVEWTGRRRRREDMTVAEWLDDRARDDSRDSVWHVTALAEFDEHLRAQGFCAQVPGLAGLSVELGDGVGDEEIARFEATRDTPVPEVLRDFWRRIGHASWSTGGRGRRILSPAEMLARRPAADAVGARYLAQSPMPSRSPQTLYRRLDVLVETLGGRVVTLLAADRQTDDARVFAHADERERDLWWERSLSWMFATGILGSFTTTVKDATPLVSQLYCDHRVDPAVAPRYFEWSEPGKDDKFWELYWDAGNGVLATRYGRPGTPGKVSTKRMDPVKGAKKAASLVAAKTAAGYQEI
ncbi:WGR domain-containing protein [Phytomonospora sp. NPDC050363]|uniref:WGR domain-containing protein n=1 Tax=Phytomonospora sp. NPDC050363 TaxID=3155642 RepID=UPI0033DC1970